RSCFASGAENKAQSRPTILSLGVQHLRIVWRKPKQLMTSRRGSGNIASAMSLERSELPVQTKPPLAPEVLRDVIELSLTVGQVLLQSGAQSKRVEQTVHALGTALGANWLDI